MFIRYLFITVFLVSVSASWAQNSEINLSQCLEYAKNNAVNVQISRLDEEIASAKVKETAGLGLPQISGSVSVINNTRLRRFFTSYSEDSFFFGGQSVPGLSEGDVVSAQNFFQLKSSGDAGLNISQLIFNGSYIVGLQASRAYKDLSVKNTDQKLSDVAEQVTKAYYLVLVNRERVDLFDQNIARIDTLLRNTSALQKQGFAESIDVDRLKVALNNLKTEREKFLNLLDLSTELLKFQMNYPMDRELKVRGRLEDMSPDIDLNEYSSGWSYESRPEYRLLSGNKKLQQLSLRNNYAMALPSVVAIANLGYSTQSPGVSGLFRTETNLKDNGSFGPDKWYSYGLVGLSVNVPVFSGLQRTFKIQQEKINLVKIEKGLSALRSGIDLEIKQALISYRNAEKSMASQKENMTLAENIARVVRIKYEQGVGSNLEVIDAESSYKEAQVNYYNALYEALVSKVSLDKAYGKLNNPTLD